MFNSVDEVRGALAEQQYIATDEIATVIYLAEKLGKPILAEGPAGVGKTRLLMRCDARIDLEGLANHRGSAFGQRVLPQPSQIDFENGDPVAIDARIIAALIDVESDREVWAGSFDSPLAPEDILG